MDWTQEQLLAINKEGTNLIVSAGAGSGKTAVLSERVIRKLKNGIDIRNILILTFTNEAAGEMKDRIRRKMEKEGLTSQLSYLDAAYITTFDAYALSLVKKYHYLFNLSENIVIIDSSIINLEKRRILDDIVMDLFENKDEHYLKLVKDFTERDDEVIKKAILNISNSLDLRYDKTEYLTHYVDIYYQDNYIDQIFEEYFLYLKNLTDLIEEDFYSLEGFLTEKVRDKCYEALSSIFKPRCYHDLERKIDLPQFRGLDEEALEIKDSLKSHVGELSDLTIYTEEDLKNQVKSTKEYVLAIIDIILKLDERIQKYKREKNAFEFVDIAKMAISLVKDNPSIREEIKQTYQEIMIDEYQDTNDLQEMFIQEIENHNVYMVGDIKQSIYRFRNANPNIFREKYDHYKKQEMGEKIDLLENFRSRREVLENINEIFNLIMIPELGGVDYQDHHAMIYGNMTYQKLGSTNQNNYLEILKYPLSNEFSNAEIEAFAIAKDIKEKIEHQYLVYDFELKSTRPVTYQDFCIILDRGTEMARYKKIFEYFNIPMVIYKDSNLTEQEDIFIIRSIVELVLAIKNREFGTNMRYYFTSIARSYAGDMSDEEIFTHLENNTFYDTLIYQKAKKIAKKLDSLTPNMLLQEIIHEYEFYQHLVLVGNIKDAMIRLDYLQSLSSSMEDLGFTIKDFVEYLTEMIDQGMEIRYKEARGEDSAVKIMNIHKSKGLEFSVCYFAGFKSKFNLGDLKSKFIVDSTYGILTPFYHNGIGTLFTKTLIKNKYMEEEIAEKIRLFYVALTRAKEKMIMVMPEVKNGNKVNGRISYLTGMKYRSFYDFLASISVNLSKYMKTINLDDLSLSKDYEFSVDRKLTKFDSDKVMEFKDIGIDVKLVGQEHASKNIASILSISDAKTLEYGTKIHEMLENTDFKHVKKPNIYVKHLLDTFDFETSLIYQEFEFFFTHDGQEYHGIIDLMLEYDSEIKIIDYKLKNIEDDAYIKQLNVYYEYMRSVSDKKISLYLYSIMDNQVKKVEVVGI